MTFLFSFSGLCQYNFPFLNKPYLRAEHTSPAPPEAVTRCVTTQMAGVCVPVPSVTWVGSHMFTEQKKKEHGTCVMIRTSDVSEGKFKHALQETPTKLRAEIQIKTKVCKNVQR